MTATPSRSEPPEVTSVSLLVAEEKLPQFTTLLQSGIYLQAGEGETIGGLLASLPGFTEDFIRQHVQTIFLNGLPADHLNQRLPRGEPVLAVSAAMPGLAGAIFRKGGVHASLRTRSSEQGSPFAGEGETRVRLKLFNIIAKERGEDILAEGCMIKAASFKKFLSFRPSLLTSIEKVTLNGEESDSQKLPDVLHGEGMIQLNITGNHGN